MKNLNLIFLVAMIFIFSCGPSGAKKEMTEKERMKMDSISKLEQSKRVDSMKKRNPLLIIPPDSLYTGSYVDKYPNGIVKFTGFFRFGQRHGQWNSFYPNGLMWSELHYDKGMREGPNKAFYETGKLRYDGFYKNDMRDSIWCYYDSLGALATKVLFKNDRVVKELPIK